MKDASALILDQPSTQRRSRAVSNALTQAQKPSCTPRACSRRCGPLTPTSWSPRANTSRQGRRQERALRSVAGDAAQVFLAQREHDPAHVPPEERSRTHRARLRARVQRAALQEPGVSAHLPRASRWSRHDPCSHVRPRPCFRTRPRRCRRRRPGARRRDGSPSRALAGQARWPQGDIDRRPSPVHSNTRVERAPSPTGGRGVPASPDVRVSTRRRVADPVARSGTESGGAVTRVGEAAAVE